MTTPQTHFLDGKKILLACERKLTHELLFSVLKQCGAGATISGTAPEMLAGLKTFKPDIIICEYAMDQISGGAFVRFVRKEMKIAAPVLMLIHRGDAEAVSQSRAVGVEQTVTVPFATVDIVTALRKIADPEVAVAKRALYFGD